jgi:hypothetical protein
MATKLLYGLNIQHLLLLGLCWGGQLQDSTVCAAVCRVSLWRSKVQDGSMHWGLCQCSTSESLGRGERQGRGCEMSVLHT